MSIGIVRQHPAITLVKNHLQRYPRMEVQDVYKLLYQGEFGVGHILDNPKAAKDYLIRELQQIGGNTEDSLHEVISPEGIIIRVHLRAFKGENLNPDDLWKAMIRTGESVVGDKARFKANWEIIRLGTEHGLIPFSIKTITEFWDNMDRRELSPVHHSDMYNSTYHPAYRVIKLDYLSDITKS